MEVFLLAAICAVLAAVYPYQAGQVVGTVVGIALSAVIALGVALVLLWLA